MVQPNVYQKNLEKRLMKRISRGEINVGYAAREMEKRGIQPTKKFSRDLWSIFGKKAEAKRAEIEKQEAYEKEKKKEEADFKKKRLEKEINRDLRQAAQKINKIMNPHLIDNRLFKRKKKQFDKIIGGVRRGKISAHQAQLMGKHLGLTDYYKWWERYYQSHPDFVYKKKTKREEQAL